MLELALLLMLAPEACLQETGFQSGIECPGENM